MTIPRRNTNSASFPVIALLFLLCSPWKNPYDPENPDYVHPFFVVDTALTTALHNDTLTETAVRVVLVGNDVETRFRWRLDGSSWNDWTKAGTKPCTISIAIPDSGRHALEVQTCYHPDAHVRDSTLRFYRAILPSIATTCDTFIDRYVDEACTLWAKGTGSEPLAYLWLKNGVETGFQSDTVVFTGLSAHQAGTYQCRVSNLWGHDSSDSIRLVVQDTTIPDFIMDSLYVATIENTLLNINFRDSCLSVPGEELSFVEYASPLDGDSLYSSGRYTWSPGYADSGHYQVSAYVTDGTTNDTFRIVIAVQNVNRPPLFHESLPGTSYRIDEGSLLEISLRASDADGDSVSLAILETNLPHKDDCVLTDRAIRWQSERNDNGAYPLRVSATDGMDTSIVSIDIGVGDVNLPPRIEIEGVADGGTIQAEENDTLQFTVAVTDPDYGDSVALQDGRNLPFENAENGAGAYDTATGEFWFVPEYTLSSQSRDDTLGGIKFHAIDDGTPPLQDSLTLRIVVRNTNRPPAVTLLTPPNGAPGLAKGTVFRWAGSDPDDDSLTYQLLVGTLSDQLERIYMGDSSHFASPQLLDHGQTYYWKVGVTDGKASAESIIRSFAVNTPPTVSLAAPAHGATDVDVPVRLSWNANDVDAQDVAYLAFDVYLSEAGRSSERIAGGIAEASFLMERIEYDQEYEWFVVANDRKDSVKSAVVTFTTRSVSGDAAGIEILDDANLSPSFSPGIDSYSVDIPFRQESLRFKVVSRDHDAAISINEDTAKSELTCTLSDIRVGHSTIFITVASIIDSIFTQYRIDVFRAAPVTFLKWFGSPSSDKGVGVYELPNKGYIIGGELGSDFYVAGVDSGGGLAWEKTYDATGYDRAYAFRPAGEQEYVLAGTDGWNFSILKVDTGGASTFLEIPHAGISRDVVTGTDNGYLMTGKTEGSDGTDELTLIKTDDLGVFSWMRRFEHTGDDEGRSVRQLPDGGYVTVGRTILSTIEMDIVLIRTDVNGYMSWQKIIDLGRREFAEVVIPVSDGGFIIAGSQDSLNSLHFKGLVIRTDPTGDVLWSRTIAQPSRMFIRAGCKTNDNCLVLAGEAYIDELAGYDAVMIKMNLRGDVIWKSNIGGSSNENALFVSQASDGGYLVTGTTSSFSDSDDILFAKTDPDGNVRITE